LEAEGSLPCSQELASGPYPEDETSPHTVPPYFPKIHSNIITLATPRSSVLSLPFGYSDQNFVRIFHLSHACYMYTNLIILHLITLITFGAVLSSLPPLPPSYVQIFSSAPCSVSAIFLVSEIKFHTVQSNRWNYSCAF